MWKSADGLSVPIPTLPSLLMLRTFLVALDKLIISLALWFWTTFNATPTPLFWISSCSVTYTSVFNVEVVPCIVKLDAVISP